MKRSSIQSTFADEPTQNSHQSTMDIGFAADNIVMTNQIDSSSANLQGPSNEHCQVLEDGSIKYGPVVIKPRKVPAKTLATGRRSKAESLSVDEEKRRNDKRERNQRAAKKYREKQENIFQNLKLEIERLLGENKKLEANIESLQIRKHDLEQTWLVHRKECLSLNLSINRNQLAAVFADQEALPYTNLSNVELSLLPAVANLNERSSSIDEWELNNLLSTDMLANDPRLINSEYQEHSMDAYTSHQPEQNTIQTSTSSFDRILNEISSSSPTNTAKSRDVEILYNSLFED